MNVGLLVIVIFLAIILIGLIFYNLSIHKKVKGLSNTSEKIANLKVLQDFMDTIAKETSVENKIRIINDILIEKYDRINSIEISPGIYQAFVSLNFDEYNNMYDLLYAKISDPRTSINESGKKSPEILHNDS